MTESRGVSQEALIALPEKRTSPAKGVPEPAGVDPVARILVDSPLPHLDRPFDYLVPASMHEDAVPGCRVRVRFAGKLTDGFLLERAAGSEHEGALLFLDRVVSPEAVLTPGIAALARAVADRYAGTMSDVLRLAIPPRHAKVEAEPPAEVAVPAPPRQEKAWAPYPIGESFLTALREGRAPRAIWCAVPGTDDAGPAWPAAVAEAMRATLAGGRGALVVLPDGKDVALLDRALTGETRKRGTSDGTATAHVALTADLGPAERYRRWLRVLRGQTRAVIGTRAQSFAPVRDLGLAVIWDDGDDLHADPHAPYPHAREILALRAHHAEAGMLIGGYAMTAEAAQLIATGWAKPLVADRETVRARAPRVRPAGEDAELARDQAARAARLPSLAWRALRQGLEHGPVLVQVPRRGYLPALACQQCRAPARCTAVTSSGPCSGPLALRGGHAMPYCRWCGRIAGEWRCPACGGARVRASVVGSRRTAEELGRAFASVRVTTSGRDGVQATVGSAPALVVATPGAEPVADGGYAAAVLLDGWALLGRPDLRAGEETLRRWLNAAALVRPGAEVVVLADAGVSVVQALLRWDPATHAERELADRAELGFPPATRMATLTGAPAAVREMLGALALPPRADVLGPVPVEAGQERAMIRVPRAGGSELARVLKGAEGVRSARKADLVRVQVDPLDLI
ncbi:putative primosomal protein N' [Acrocarpospora corrugata]|uniref:Probable replication restart protein PriA n=1 Tax=Acrocarpospora corrugata TaxID=35763 RepID=A0A5M3VQN7_9ACTN|nr:primosomal protein N' [Acrocarpospora corrugata]GER98965.1 putative primosomal protein N' [Acrocarpospora corrugata]